MDAWDTGFLDAGQATQLIADCRAYDFNAVIAQMRRRVEAVNNFRFTAGCQGCMFHP